MIIFHQFSEVFFVKGPVESDKMVVLYDGDAGHTAHEVGNKFVTRGVENTYVVSGGFLSLAATVPHVLVGEPPTPDALVPLMAKAGLKMPGSGASTAGSIRPSVSGARSVRGFGGAPPSTAGSARTGLLSSIGGGSPTRSTPWK